MTTFTNVARAWIALSLATAMAAAAAAQSTTLSSLTLTIRTGGDDLRAGSIAFAQIIYADGRSERMENISRGANWPNNSTRTVSLPLARPTAPSAFNGAVLRISEDGGGRDVGDGYDNWNVDSVRLTTPPVCTGGGSVASATGKPWHRFTGEATQKSLRVSAASAVAGQQPAALVLKVRTGGDDKRAGTHSTAQVRLRDGRTPSPVSINAGGKLADNSWVDVRLPLPKGVRVSEVASIDFLHSGELKAFGESYDNWNVDAVKLEAEPVCSARTLGASATSVRLTGTKRWFDIPLSIGG